MAAQPTLVAVTPLLPAGPSLAEGLRYYVEHLGFAVSWQDGAMAGVRRGRVEFNLVENGDRHWAKNTSVSIGVDDLDALYAEYQASAAAATTAADAATATATVLGPLEVKAWGRREFHMILPSGVCLQFYDASV